jgi:DNA-binding GntR family transcriptional regulator
MTSADLNRAAEVADAMRRNTDEAAWSYLNWAFHAALVEPARRPWTIGLLRKVYLNVYRHFPAPIRVTGNREQMLADHDQLLVLCGDRDAGGAVDLLERHIIGSGASLIQRRGAVTEAIGASGAGKG